ncbi:hypothetical protein [Amycolatopsis rubida]|uniref:Uncharacterized protein n=1 Tax=Amycolatopsis rubida TaxID=112413 RepID=A0A1I5X972_9PSEU|nr:hypothetical protein [Amycolatopsis rubida]SFQ28518.1 hypothetical protein SAMN05421854_110106 [Amycolatopsis rubida]
MTDRRLTPAEAAVFREAANLFRWCVREEETEDEWAVATHPDQQAEHSRYGSMATNGRGINMAPAFFDGVLSAAALLEFYADGNPMPLPRDHVTAAEAYRALQNITGDDPAAWRPVDLR